MEILIVLLIMISLEWNIKKYLLSKNLGLITFLIIHQCFVAGHPQHIGHEVDMTKALFFKLNIDFN